MLNGKHCISSPPPEIASDFGSSTKRSGIWQVVLFFSVVVISHSLLGCSENASDNHARKNTPLPGNPAVIVDPNKNGRWEIIGMNYNWMVLIADGGRISLSGDTVRVRWEYTKPQADGNEAPYLSEDLLYEVRCKQHSWRLVAIRQYGENNLNGRLLVDIENWRIGEWESPNYESIFGTVIKAVCE